MDGDLLAPVPAVNKGKFPLALYDDMCRAIDLAYEVDEAKDIRDRALAFEIYARQAKNIDAERRACEVRLRAERKAGSLLQQINRASRGRPKETSNDPTLSNLGVSRDQSSQWQRLADVPQEQFDEALADPDRKPTTAGIIAATTPPEPEVIPVSKDALWLWGRLRDFERDGLLSQLPEDVLLTMTPQMRDDVHRLAPTVSAWLKRIGASDV